MAEQYKNNIKVLFVCHGNICRSPMAQFYMKDLVKRHGLQDLFHIESAATSTEEIGNPVHPGTRKKLAEAGISCAGKTARQMTRADYEKFDYLVGMDSQNIRNMMRIAGGDPEGKIHKMMDFAEGHDAESRCHTESRGLDKVRADWVRDVADPWYTGDFEATWQDITEGCDGLLTRICREYGLLWGQNRK